MSGLAHDPTYPKDVLRRAKPESAITWIGDYCKAHPLYGLAYAGVALVNELAKQAHGSK